MRRAVVPSLALAVTLVLALSACSGDDSSPDAATPPMSPASSIPPSSTPPSSTATDPADPAAEPAYNPCDDLGAVFVGQALGVVVTEDAGTADEPSCTYRPVVTGGPALSVNYLVSDLDFDAAWASMGETAGVVSDVPVATADHARMVVNATDEAVAVTGFVQTGQVIENVNVVALAPYDQASIERATLEILTRLSATATEAGSLSGGPEPTDLLGAWLLRRVIDDRLDAVPRRVTGTTTLSLEESGDVTWSEAGSMTWGEREVEVARTLHVVRRGDGWWVVFADGRDFHPWAPGRSVDHPCGADHYRGLVTAGTGAGTGGPITRWSVRWDVRGPQKDYTMTSELTRPL